MNMKWVISLILVINISNAQNVVTDTISSWAKKSGFLDFLFNKSGCPEIYTYKHLPDQTAEELFAKAYELRAKQKDCDSVQYFQEVRRQWPVRPYYNQAWKEIVMSYVLADDYPAAINEGNDFMDHMRGAPEVEEIHLVLINSVNLMMMKAGSERSQEWTEYALGISKRQNDDNPYLKNLSFKSFMDKYPDSPNIKTIEGMMRVARNNHAEYHLKIGDYYAKRVLRGMLMPNYPAAVLRYDVVLKWGPIVSSFNQALYSTIEVLYKMKQAIETPNMLPEDTLKEWLQIDSLRDKKLVDRKALVVQIDVQISDLIKKADSETITQDIWIQKAKALVQVNQK